MHESGIYHVKPDADGMKVIRGEKRICEDYPDYLRDESNTEGSSVEAIFFPQTVEHIAAALQDASAKHKSLTLSGARTGICAGAVPQGGYLLSLEKMTDVVNFEEGPDGFVLTAQSGLRLSDLSLLLKNRELGIDNEAAGHFSEQGKQFFYPPDPTETTATLGGTVATNASGARTLFYGPTRSYVTGLEVVLPSGELLRIRRGDITAKDGVFTVQKERGRPLVIPAPGYSIPKTKHSAGLFAGKAMDLIDLFIGSEGILGVISQVSIRLVEEPVAIYSGAAFLSTEEHAIDFVMQAKELHPLALEYFDSASLALLAESREEEGPISEIPAIPQSGACVYFEFSYDGEETLRKSVTAIARLIDRCHGNGSVSWGALTKRDQQRLKSFRHALPESINKIIAHNKQKYNGIHKVGTDMAVPDLYLKDMVKIYRSTLEKERIRYVIFGHIGNSHLHVNMIPSTRDELLRAKQLYKVFAEKAVEMGGSVSAEHGIGKLKRDFLKVQYSENEIGEMKAAKEAVDPTHMLNPGDVL
jgi:D-lactate dehydrogenase (cytochrome)